MSLLGESHWSGCQPVHDNHVDSRDTPSFHKFEVVFCREDEIHFVVHYDDPIGVRHQAKKRLSGFIAYRILRFQDQPALVSWCSNCPCGNATCAMSVCEGGMRVSSMTRDAFLEGSSDGYCCCARKLQELTGGPEYLMQMMRVYMPMYAGKCFTHETSSAPFHHF